MTLRYDDYKRPIGLDWSVCNDGNSRPEVWGFSQLIKKTRKRAPIKQPGVGRGGVTRLTPEIENQVIELYTTTTDTPKQIGKKFGISRQVIYKVLHRNEVPTRTRSEAMILVRNSS